VTGNSWRDEMIADGIENCLIYVNNFDPKKSSNPFGYFTTIAYWAFVRRIQREKKQDTTKNKYIVSLNLDDVILQEGDEGSYANEFVEYLKKKIDTANAELDADKVKPTVEVRKPLYMSRKKKVMKKKVTKKKVVKKKAVKKRKKKVK
jgi:hypothetical protein